MKNETLFEALREIDPQYIESAAPKNRIAKASLIRTLAVAACVALLAAGMLAALPFMLGGNEQPPVVEPPVIEPSDNTAETEDSIRGTEDETTTDLGFSFSPPLWYREAFRSYAIIEIIEKEEDKPIFYPSRDGNNLQKIKCRVIYSYNTEGYFFEHLDTEFDKLESIYIHEQSVDEIMENEVILFSIDRYGSGDGIIFPKTDYEGNVLYLPIKDGRLVLNEESNYYSYGFIQGLEFINWSIDSYAPIDSGLYANLAKVFPKKYFENGMTIDDIIENYNALWEARLAFDELRFAGAEKSKIKDVETD